MTKNEIIEQIDSYLPHLKEEVLEHFLGLLKNIRTEQEDDEWDLQMAEDAQAGRLDGLIKQGLAEYARGEATDLLEGLKKQREELTS